MLDGIPCPHCGHRDSAVKDSRPGDEMIRRRRMCLECGERFTTYEARVAEYKIGAMRQGSADLAAAVEDADRALARIRQALNGFGAMIRNEAYLANGARIDTGEDDAESHD